MQSSVVREGSPGGCLADYGGKDLWKKLCFLADIYENVYFPNVVVLVSVCWKLTIQKLQAEFVQLLLRGSHF